MEIALFFHQFATLLKAGIPLQQSLGMAGKGCSQKLQRSLRETTVRIETGSDLASALDKQFFNPWMISLLRSAEYSGALAETCERLATNLEIQKNRRRLYRSVNTSIVLVLFSGLALLIALLQGSTGFLLQPWFWLVGLLLIAGFVFLTGLAGSQSLGQEVLRALSPIPVVNKILQARSLLYFAELELPLRCGIPILQALELVHNHIPDRVMAQHLRNASRHIQAGQTLSQSMQGKLSPLAMQMLRTGEETGSLEAMLSKLAHYYENELETTLNQLQGILRPIGIVAAGILVLLIGIQSFTFLKTLLP